MTKSILFDSWRKWKNFFLEGAKSFAFGFCRMVAAIVLGFLSLFRWLWRCLCNFVSANPKTAIVMFVVIIGVIWLLTFVNMRCRAVGAENQRDSIAWQYQNFKEEHGYE